MNENANESLRSIDQYEIVRELGRGGTSVVYLAEDRSDGKTYAIKVLRRVSSVMPKTVHQTAEQLNAKTPEQPHMENAWQLTSGDAWQLTSGDAGQMTAEHAAQLRAEAEVLREICNHHREPESGCRSIPAYRECVCDENGDFAGFVMEYVDGRSLQQILEEGRRYNIREAAEAGLRLCAVMKRLHCMDPPMIYRDLKPANILIRPDGTWALVDFGAVRKYRKGAGKDTERLGTEGYAAPEQYGGWEQSDERTDIYGVGAVLHHMITGRPPLETGLRPLEEFRDQTGGDGIPLCCSYMNRVLLRCCSAAPSMRYPNCGELEKALSGVIRMCGRTTRRTSDEDTGGAGSEVTVTAGTGAGADRIWRKIILLIGAAGVFLVCSGMLAVSSAEAGKKEYRKLIEIAQEESDLNKKTEAYRRAVRARPADAEAHLAFLRELSEDHSVTQEEKEALDSAAFVNNSMERIREKRPGEYTRLQMELGWVYFACYEGGTEAARAAFENAGRTAGLWLGRREVAAAMGVVLSEVWTQERIKAWRLLERVSIREAFRTGEGEYAGAVCKAALTEIALFPDRYERSGADEEAVKEVTETAVKFAEETEKGGLQVPDRIREELRAAVKSMRQEEGTAIQRATGE